MREIKSMWVIKSVRDEDGGFGDAVEKESVVAIVETEQLAKRIVDELSDPKIYESPYNDLYEGELRFKKIPIVKSIDEFKLLEGE